ncbi:MAG: DUF2680 domain-containing protein [Firmicutes bacterium]|nr:DUF2680 domain-containing protein [Bacillota bacterium]
MKKGLIIVLLISLVSLLAVPAFAADTSNSYETYYKQMIEARKAWIDQAVEQGYMTREQGQLYKQNLGRMYQYRMQNGSNYYPMGWGCHGMYYGGYGQWQPSSN